jgi:phage terminase small subunit
MQHLAPLRTALSQRESDFVPLFVEHGDAHRAALAAGWPESTARAAGTEILNRPSVALAIARAARLRLARGVPMALGVLEYLAEKAKSEKVRLDAATRMLDRAGIVPPKPPNEQSEFEKPLHEMNLAELRVRAARLEDEIAGRARVVTDTPDPAEDLRDRCWEHSARCGSAFRAPG